MAGETGNYLLKQLESITIQVLIYNEMYGKWG